MLLESNGGVISKEVSIEKVLISQDNLILGSADQEVVISALTPVEKFVLRVIEKVKSQQVVEEEFVKATVETVVHKYAVGTEQIFEIVGVDLPYTHEEQEYLLLKERGMEDEQIEELLNIAVPTPWEKFIIKIKTLWLKIKLIFLGWKWILIPIIFIVVIYIIYKFIQTFVITKAQKVAKKKIKL